MAANFITSHFTGAGYTLQLIVTHARRETCNLKLATCTTPLCRSCIGKDALFGLYCASIFIEMIKSM